MLNRVIKHNPGVSFVIFVVWPSLVVLYFIIMLATSRGS